MKPFESQARDHLANERTFLAWVRTSIGIMAFGFVVERFALFIKEMGLILGNPQTLQGYSSIFGVLLVALGAIICLLAFIKYRTVEKQIKNASYQPSGVLNILLTISVLLMGIFLIFYLNNSI